MILQHVTARACTLHMPVVGWGYPINVHSTTISLLVNERPDRHCWTTSCPAVSHPNATDPPSQPLPHLAFPAFFTDSSQFAAYMIVNGSHQSLNTHRLLERHDSRRMPCPGDPEICRAGSTDARAYLRNVAVTIKICLRLNCLSPAIDYNAGSARRDHASV